MKQIIDKETILKYNPYHYYINSRIYSTTLESKYLPKDLTIINSVIEAYTNLKNRDFPLPGDTVTLTKYHTHYKYGLIQELWIGNHKLSYLEQVNRIDKYHICLQPRIPFVWVNSKTDNFQEYSVSTSGGHWEILTRDHFKPNPDGDCLRSFQSWDSRGRRANGTIKYPILTKSWVIID